ncbi:YqaJ viral recombinase family protein [Treponema primitia]|uniref:YqaJ viral recombinase family protein n=1 Tax=Treponema primitia TaxID=88058 RepID=UPI00397EC8AD
MGSTPRNISGSRAASILGHSPFATPLQTFQQIMEDLHPGWNDAHGYTLPEHTDTAATRFGLAFESAIVELSERETGLKIGDREKLFEMEIKGLGPITSCHVDGIFSDDSVYEAKTTSSFMFRESWGTPGTDRIPEYYQVQLQHNLMLSGKEEAKLFLLCFPETPEAWEKMGWEILDSLNKDGSRSYFLVHEDMDIHVRPQLWADTLYMMGFFHTYRILAKPDVQQSMVERYRDFWTRYVIPGIPPEPQNYADIQRLFVKPVGTIVCDEELTRWWSEYDLIGKEIGKSGQGAKRREVLKMDILGKARKIDAVVDEESCEKIIFRSADGKKLGQYSRNSGFRS